LLDEEDEVDLIPEKQSAVENRFERGVFGRGEGA